MKKHWIHMTIISLVFSLGVARAQDIAIGTAAPNFKLPDVNGNIHELASFKGKFVVLEWTNPDCPFVRKHYGSGNMQALQKEFTGKDVVWFSICSSAPGKQGNFTPEEWQKRLAAAPTSATAVLLDPDGKVGRAYGARTTPHMFVINPAGELIFMGGIDDRPGTNVSELVGAKNYVRAALEAALAGQPISDPTPKPYGCSVKY